MLDMIVSLDTQLTLWLNGSESVFLDTFAMTATKTTTWVPLALLLVYLLVRMRNWKNALLIMLSVALVIILADQMASGIFKPLVARLRPSQNPELDGLIDLVDGYRGGRYGFFSSHAANTCGVAVFLSLLFRHKWFTGTISSWALLNCWTRLYLGVHYVGDILVGVLWGCCVGWMVYRLYRYLDRRYMLRGAGLFTSERAQLLTEGILLIYVALLIYAACYAIL